MSELKQKKSRISMKVLNQSAWLLLLMTYVLPYRVTDGFETRYGYPFAFLSTYGNEVGLTPIMSTSVNGMILLVDIVLIYYGVTLLMKVARIKHD